MKQQKKHFNKFLSSVLVLSFFNSNFVLASNEIIKDELVETTLKNKNLKIEKYQKPYFNDELTQFLDYVEKPQTKSLYISNEDLYALKQISKPLTNQNTVIVNEDISKLKLDKNIVVVNSFDKDKFQDTLSILTIKPTKRITANKCKLGQYVEFKTVGKIKFKNNLIQDGTPIIGRITNITKNGFAGTPGDITVERFEFKDRSKRNIKIEGIIEKHGANRSVWVIPLVSAGNIFTGFGGYVFYVIKGGHAKLKSGDSFELELIQN